VLSVESCSTLCTAFVSCAVVRYVKSGSLSGGVVCRFVSCTVFRFVSCTVFGSVSCTVFGFVSCAGQVARLSFGGKIILRSFAACFPKRRLGAG